MSESKSTSNAGKLVWAGVILLGILHQDVWFWERFEPLVFGFVPIGLAYHIGISLAAAALWFLATKHCWPEGVDDAAPEENAATKAD